MHLKFYVAAAVAVFFDMSTALVAAAAQFDAPMQPRVESVTIHASELRLGMTEQEMSRIMGEPIRATDYMAGGVKRRKLDFSGPIPSTVVIANGEVSRVAVDVFQVDKGDLPAFSRKAWPGMATSAVRRSLGDPSDIRHYAFFGIKLDQWVYAGSVEPEVSLFFAADRVIAKTLGRRIPRDIFQVRLPGPPLQPRNLTEGPRVGMAIDDVQALYGEMKLHVGYVFNGQRASRVIFETRTQGSFTAVTFVDGRLIEFEDLGRLPDAGFLGR
jgi:hypothetical protein